MSYLLIEIGGIKIRIKFHRADRGLADDYKHFEIAEGTHDAVLNVTTVHPSVNPLDSEKNLSLTSSVTQMFLREYDHRFPKWDKMISDTASEQIFAHRDKVFGALQNHHLRSWLEKYTEPSNKDIFLYPLFLDSLPSNNAGILCADRKTWHAELFIDKRISEIRDMFSQALYILLSLLVHAQRGLLLHACGVASIRGTDLFLGSSGAGKTTVAKLSKSRFIMGDDGIILRKAEHRDDFIAHPTPWLQYKSAAGHGMHTNNAHDGINSSVRRLFFIKHGETLTVTKRSKAEAVRDIFLHLIHFAKYLDKQSAATTFRVCAQLLNSAPAYEMVFARKSVLWPALENINNYQKEEVIL
ncbi:MAG TPA: hypothetical protein ENI11_02325 [Actinobacteria bacterium]|nr:hypothetical protein [Actinomycetota bacterium]